MGSIQRSQRSLAMGVLLLAGATAARATTYYVDSKAGSDGANGTTATTAWQHLKAVNTFAAGRGFHAGDKILLKNGSRWGEQLELAASNSTNSGAAGNVLTISSYGQGEMPTIDGADEVKGWTSAGDGVFKAQVKGPVYKVFVDGANRETKALQAAPNYLGPYAPGRVYEPNDTVSFNHQMWEALHETQKSMKIAEWYHTGMLPPEQQDAGVKNVARMPGMFFYDAGAGTLYVHLADGSNPSSHAVQASVRRYGVSLKGVNYVAVTNLRMIHAAKAGLLATTSTSGGNEYGTVQNDVFWNDADRTSDADTRGEGAIYIMAPMDGTAQGGGLRGWVVADNAVGRIDSAMAVSYSRSGIYLSGTAGAAVRNNFVATVEAVGISVATDGKGPACTEPVVSGNLLTDNQGNLRISGCAKALVDSNIIRNSAGYGVQTGGNSLAPVLTHNVIHDLAASASKGLYNGVDCNGGAPNGTLAYNSISAVWGAEATLEVGCDHWTVHDNYFDSSNNAGNGGLTLYIRQESLPGMQFQNNHYNVTPTTNRQFNVGAGQPGVNTYHDVTWWQANQDTTAKTGEPAPKETAIASGGRLTNLAAAPMGRTDAAIRGGAQQALPVKPFHATPAMASLQQAGGGEKP